MIAQASNQMAAQTNAVRVTNIVSQSVTFWFHMLDSSSNSIQLAETLPLVLAVLVLLALVMVALDAQAAPFPARPQVKSAYSVQFCLSSPASAPGCAGGGCSICSIPCNRIQVGLSGLSIIIIPILAGGGLVLGASHVEI